jgi:hypothetical protein
MSKKINDNNQKNINNHDIITKIKSHFGEESLLMYSKSCDYYQINPLNREDIEKYYKYLKSNQEKRNENNLNEISCCLYYLSQNNKNYQEEFISYIIERLDIGSDPINDQNLVLIYNIIEFDEQYLKSDRTKLDYLLNYLERFSIFPKSRTNFLLFKYYRGCLKLNLGDYESANLEYLEFIAGYTDEIINANKETKYTSFIKLKNDLLNIRINKVSQGDDIHQTRIILKNLFDRTKKENQILSMKIGFELYDIYLKNNKYKECNDILFDMKAILKNRLLTGIKMNSSIDYYLAIVSRIGFIGTLINDKPSIENCIEKISKSFPIFNNNNNSNKEKGNIFINAYSFLLTILKINNKEEVSNPKEAADNFKSYFLPYLNKIQNNQFNSFIVNESNFNDIVVNLNIINKMDHEINNFWKKEIYNPMINTITQNKSLQHNSIITFILSVHNLINQYSESYCTEQNVDKDKYKNNIIDLTEKTLKFVKKFCSDEIMFQTEFIKGALINIFSSYAHAFLYNKDYNKIKNLVNTISDINKILKFNEKTPNYELLCKLKGDFWLFSSFKDIQASLSFYEKAINLLPKNHPKKPIILFNMGYCHYLNKNRKTAVEYLNKCINEFNLVEKNHSCFEFYHRANVIKTKINVAKKMIYLLTEGQ